MRGRSPLDGNGKIVSDYFAAQATSTEEPDDESAGMRTVRNGIASTRVDVKIKSRGTIAQTMHIASNKERQ